LRRSASLWWAVKSHLHRISQHNLWVVWGQVGTLALLSWEMLDPLCPYKALLPPPDINEIIQHRIKERRSTLWMRRQHRNRAANKQ